MWLRPAGDDGRACWDRGRGHVGYGERGLCVFLPAGADGRHQDGGHEHG